MHRSSNETIISALRALARDVQSEDGVANACLAEAADRLENLHAKALTVLEWYYRVGDVGGAVDPMDELREAAGVTEEFLCRK